MEGKVIIVVGRRGSGKTTAVRKLIKNVHKDALLLHDIGGQYKDLYDGELEDFDTFTKKCTNVSNAVCVFEEATIYVPPTRDQTIVEFLVTSRYKGNTIIFVFHSFRTVPYYIYNLANIIIVHKTNEDNDFVFDRFKDKGLVTVFERTMNDKNPYAENIHRIDS